MFYFITGIVPTFHYHLTTVLGFNYNILGNLMLLILEPDLKCLLRKFFPHKLEMRKNNVKYRKVISFSIENEIDSKFSDLSCNLN